MGIFTSKAFDHQRDLKDLTGCVAVVTGGNTGIGYETIKVLAKRGAKIYMAARNESKAHGAITALEHEGVPAGSVVWQKLDLVDLPGVKAAAEEIMRKEKRLDLLINNAGIVVKLNEDIYPDGVLEYIMINYVGPWLFTLTLLPLLKQTAKKAGFDVRIVNVASHAHNFLPDGLRFRNLEELNNNFKSSLRMSSKFYQYSKSLYRRVLVPIILMKFHFRFIDRFFKTPKHPLH
ncbi:hypothetical protein AX16_010622 [Volvariella volvacea WC 439]|nr:hypothetical protein AX16_010622 [Volvariella volvacea WC 439]